ncbi:hypothetical protein [Paenibacillus xerothermodurans]|uniref:Uncharacterized protein n=1 Tax=Paenibacillus xerothermodurans TaxID=1977292 RepID=A0A2W1NV62_PAEXE|nr:hypothetical protein [Paenibacillus xerothermodurans]PZE19572.1 hypothetical protein CBW46_017800 [Paenibacillus xerothermodurans]
MWVVKTVHRREEDHGVTALELETEDQHLDVNIRWDGCAEIHVYSVTEEDRELRDTFHTCDLKAFIRSLQMLDTACQDYFGEGSYWQQARQR